MKKKSFKKILFEAIKWLAVYIFLVVYCYYNLPEPENRYGWLIVGIMLPLIYLAYWLTQKREKNKKK